MIIGLDIDDTIADTYEVFYAYVQKFVVEELKRELILFQPNLALEGNDSKNENKYCYD